MVSLPNRVNLNQLAGSRHAASPHMPLDVRRIRSVELRALYALAAFVRMCTRVANKQVTPSLASKAILPKVASVKSRSSFGLLPVCRCSETDSYSPADQSVSSCGFLRAEDC
jgi:hypothetical protein